MSGRDCRTITALRWPNMVEDSRILASHRVVRWRLVDLC
jgi:hypothetical protein